MIVVSRQMGLEHSEIQLAGSSGQEVVSLSVIRYPLSVIPAGTNSNRFLLITELFQCPGIFSPLLLNPDPQFQKNPGAK